MFVDDLGNLSVRFSQYKTDKRRENSIQDDSSQGTWEQDNEDIDIEHERELMNIELPTWEEEFEKNKKYFQTLENLIRKRKCFYP